MMTTDFWDRLSDRLEKIDKKELQNYLMELLQERVFLSSLIDLTQEGILVSRNADQVVFLNRRMKQLFDISDEIADAKKTRLSDLVMDPELLKYLTHAIHHHEEIFDEDIEVLIPRPMLVKLSLVFHAISGQEYAVLLMENISQTENAIREQFQKENWVSMIGLAAGIAHELGNPLNSISIHLKLIEKQLERLKIKPKDDLAAHLKVIDSEMKRLDQTIRNFLRATRKKPFRFELTNINEIISAVIDLLAPELHGNRISTKLFLSDEVPEFLIDRDRMQQVLINIIKNACQAMPDGGSLNIRTDRKDKLCFIEFKDSGIGIPKPDLPKLFTSYYTTKEEGSGLGLMIVHQIIREHQGRIEAVSREGKGTSIRITLPIRKEKLGLPNLNRSAKT